MEGLRYRFGRVEVDPLRARVEIAGREVACQPLAFALLVELCRAEGATLSRDQLLALLWPERRVVSDESLTQVIHRLRFTLGADAAAIRTVRKRGVRLDASVQTLPGRSSIGPHAASVELETHRRDGPLPAPEPTASGRRLGKIPAALGLCLVVATALAVVWIVFQRREIDAGYGLHRSDVDGARRETAGLIREATRVELDGQRAQAVVLLETAHARDQRSPLPAALLSLFTQEDAPRRRWASEAEQRLAPTTPVYTRLFTTWTVQLAEDRGPQAAATLSSLLAARPRAWRLRLARAHELLARREPAAALSDLRRIPIRALDARGLGLVLADRASLGDLEAAEAAFARSALPDQPAVAAYVAARFAWTRGQTELAYQGFTRATAAAVAAGQPELELASRLLAGLMASELGRPEARALLEEVAAVAHQQQRSWTSFEARLAIVSLEATGSALARSEQTLARVAAEAVAVGDLARACLTLRTLALGLPPPEDPLEVAASLAPRPELLGVDALIRARLAAGSGQPDTARVLLQHARDAGLARTFFFEEGELLGAELGEQPSGCVVDPPYPLVARFAVCRELRDAGFEGSGVGEESERGESAPSGRGELGVR